LISGSGHRTAVSEVDSGPLADEPRLVVAVAGWDPIQLLQPHRGLSVKF